jgi:hypothetical protein
MEYLEIANLTKNARVAAVKDMTDQVMLEKFVREDTESGVKCAAAWNLTNPKVLIKIMNDVYQVRWIVEVRLENIIDPFKHKELIHSMLLNSDETIRRIALRKTSDQNVLAQFALYDSSENVRGTALYVLTDKNAYDEALLQAPPHIRRQHLRHYLKIRLFGTHIFRQAKKIRNDRAVPGVLLRGLNDKLSEWNETICEYSDLFRQQKEWSDKVRKIAASIAEVEDAQNRATDNLVRESYDPMLTDLRNQKAELSKSLQMIDLRLEDVKKRKEEILVVFKEATKAAEMYQKHGEVMKNVLANQTEIKGLLEKTEANSQI